MSSLSKEQKIHDLAVAFASVEYKNELDRRRGTPNEPKVSVQDRVPGFYTFYADAVRELISDSERYSVLYGD